MIYPNDQKISKEKYQYDKPLQGHNNIQISYSSPLTPVLVTESQGCGIALASLGIFFEVINILSKISTLLNFNLIIPNRPLFIACGYIRLISNFCFLYFGIRIVADKEYLAGKPGLQTFWPHLVSVVCVLASYFILIASLYRFEGVFLSMASIILIDFIYIGSSYFAYSQDDFNGSGCLCLKPYVKVRPVTQIYQMYPNQGYYPPQYPAPIYPQNGYAEKPKQYPQQPFYQQQPYQSKV